MAHRWGKIKTDDLNSEKSYSNVYCYANSKLANILFTRELARRLKDTKITTNALHPGVINTELSRHTGEISFFFSKYFVKPAMYIFNKTPKQGAQTTIYAGTIFTFLLCFACNTVLIKHLSFQLLIPILRTWADNIFRECRFMSLLCWFIACCHCYFFSIYSSVLNWSLFFAHLYHFFSSECGIEKVYDQGLDDDMAKWLWNISEKWTKLSSKSE